MVNPLWTYSFWEATPRCATSVKGGGSWNGTQCLYLSCSLCLICMLSTPSHPHCTVALLGQPSITTHNRQRVRTWRETEQTEETDSDERQKQKQRGRGGELRRETEGDRERDGWRQERRHTDRHSPTDGELWGHLEDTWGSYEPIWFLLQERPSVTNGKVGAGKHISVTARHCRKTN